MGYYKLKGMSAAASIAVAQWLIRHGRAVRPQLSRGERADCKACFQLMDLDGSGAIDSSELWQAFQLLRIRVTKAKVNDLDASRLS